MERFEFDLVFGERRVRLAVWPCHENGQPSWRAAWLRRLPDGRHVRPGDAPVVVNRWPEEALGRIAARAAESLLPQAATKAGLPLPPMDPPLRALPTPVASLPADVIAGPSEVVRTGDLPRPTREERAAHLAATVDAACERLAEQLAAGHTEAYLQFLAFHAKFHTYSPANALLIQSQCPDATRVAGLSTWNKLGYRVRAGEKAIWIWAPILKKGVDAVTGEEGATLVGFRPAPVFDASQLANLEEKPLPTIFTPLPDDVEELYQQARARIEAERIVVEERPLPPGVQGVSLGGTIFIRPGLDSRNRLAVLLHELAHELAHRGDVQRAKPVALRELEAESTAYVVGAALGLEVPHSADYLLGYGVDASALRAALGTVHGLAQRLVAVLGKTTVDDPAAS